MDNFDLHKYLRNNPLLAESVDNRLTKKKLKEMVREMAKEVENTPDETNVGKALNVAPNVVAKLKLINQPTELDGTFKLVLDYSELKDISKSTIVAALRRALEELEPDSQTINTVGEPEKPKAYGTPEPKANMFSPLEETIELSPREIDNKFNQYHKEAKDKLGYGIHALKAAVERLGDELGMNPTDMYNYLEDLDKQRGLFEVALDEMARIAKPSKLADDWEEKMANLPDRFKKSTRFDRVIKYFQKYKDKIGQPVDPNTDPLTAKAIDFYGTLAHIADEEFQSSDTASAAPIVSALKDAGVVVSGDFVTEPAKYSKEPSVPGAKGRPKTETGYFQNAMAKFKEGNYDFSPEEKNALENMVKALQAALTKPEPKAKKK